MYVGIISCDDRYSLFDRDQRFDEIIIDEIKLHPTSQALSTTHSTGDEQIEFAKSKNTTFKFPLPASGCCGGQASELLLLHLLSLTPTLHAPPTVDAYVHGYMHTCMYSSIALSPKPNAYESTRSPFLSSPHSFCSRFARHSDSCLATGPIAPPVVKVENDSLSYYVRLPLQSTPFSALLEVIDEHRVYSC